mmetsp:Transcript_34457/g.80572  ORF Transcript_34457/g.80572 Transcript_34457/m.80572 type:complete len:403 (-) Transcript_34457:94-1302(-)
MGWDGGNWHQKGEEDREWSEWQQESWKNNQGSSWDSSNKREWWDKSERGWGGEDAKRRRWTQEADETQAGGAPGGFATPTAGYAGVPQTPSGCVGGPQTPSGYVGGAQTPGRIPRTPGTEDAPGFQPPDQRLAGCPTTPTTAPMQGFRGQAGPTTPGRVPQTPQAFGGKGCQTSCPGTPAECFPRQQQVQGRGTTTCPATPVEAFARHHSMAQACVRSAPTPAAVTPAPGTPVQYFPQQSGAGRYANAPGTPSRQCPGTPGQRAPGTPSACPGTPAVGQPGPAAMSSGMAYAMPRANPGTAGLRRSQGPTFTDGTFAPLRHAVRGKDTPTWDLPITVGQIPQHWKAPKVEEKGKKKADPVRSQQSQDAVMSFAEWQQQRRKKSSAQDKSRRGSAAAAGRMRS